MKSELPARRFAAAGYVAAIVGALGYVCGRAYFYVVIGSHGPMIILREARVNFHLALVIAAFLALVGGLLAAELARTESRVARLERLAERAVLPILAIAMALMFVWP